MDYEISLRILLCFFGVKIEELKGDEDFFNFLNTESTEKSFELDSSDKRACYAEDYKFYLDYLENKLFFKFGIVSFLDLERTSAN